MVTRTAEPELYKDKIEVSLDGRQIFYLFFGGAVVACLVFVLGVMVGRRLEARAHVDRAASTSVRKDPLAALDRLAEGKGEMTYPAALRGAEAPVADVDRMIEAKKPEAPAKAPEKKLDEKKPDDKKVDEKKPDDKKPDDKKPAVSDDDGPVAKPDAAPKAAAAAAAPAAAAANSKAKFTLQLSAFQEQAEADAFIATVKGAGYKAYVVSAEVDGKMFYRVRLGNYGSYDEAVAAKAEFERKVPKIAYVTRL